MILDFLFTTGQAAAAMLLLYGALLVIGTATPELEERSPALKHIHDNA